RSRRVGSPRLKLLFEIYHVQIMHGDLLRRLEQNKDILGHIHTAGNPGRGELDDRQEIQYAPLMRKLLEIDYKGYVGQEFIPTRDPREGLRQAVKLCDVWEGRGKPRRGGIGEPRAPAWGWAAPSGLRKRIIQAL